MKLPIELEQAILDKDFAINYDKNSEYIENEAAYLWLDNTGHGKNGAPLDMRDVIADMEECEDAIYQLFLIVDEYCQKISE